MTQSLKIQRNHCILDAYSLVSFDSRSFAIRSFILFLRRLASSFNISTMYLTDLLDRESYEQSETEQAESVNDTSDDSNESSGC
eukprot:CAMPEP_0198269780 /NCGR_PEP_ID=MMETSP1447-20131203/42535_1 /TAXON_ID=420782 /ORGANISM="Chaetoceros dichaeta, Strain CCMP1751" /LENGTH=83 /DNA_ID=CAMNT_0043961503 /DNA_START=58 /DNA_END=309 /DNA_ORIENTATION=+